MTAPVIEHTHVTDPFPAHPWKSGDHCGFTLYPNPDEVEFCDRPAVAILTDKRCGHATLICADCLEICRAGLNSWFCAGCNIKVETAGTQVEFQVQWL